jgi:hypothetical protein
MNFISLILTSAKGSSESAQYDKALADYQKATAQRQTVPVVGDSFFRFFSFEPGGFFQPLLSLSLFYVPIAIFLCVFSAARAISV